MSILMQYWGASQRRTIAYAEGTADFVRELCTRLDRSMPSTEVLVNSDSRHVRNGDTRVLLPALSTCASGFLLLSPNLGEAHAFNALARMARGEHLLFVQDDWSLAADGRGALSWLSDSFALLGAQHGVGLIGFDMGVHGMQCTKHWGTEQNETEGVPLMVSRAPAEQARCQRRWGKVSVLGAQRCVTMGPLLIRHSLFAHLGGYDERLFRRGEPASLLDCELSARVWSAGLAVVLARTTRGHQRRPFVQRPETLSNAWSYLHHVQEATTLDAERCFHINRIVDGMGEAGAPPLDRRVAQWDATMRERCARPTDAKIPLQPPRALGVGVAASRPRIQTDLFASLTSGGRGVKSAVNISFAVQYWGGAPPSAPLSDARRTFFAAHAHALVASCRRVAHPACVPSAPPTCPNTHMCPPRPPHAQPRTHVPGAPPACSHIGYREPFDDFFGNYTTRLEGAVLPMLTRLTAVCMCSSSNARLWRGCVAAASVTCGPREHAGEHTSTGHGGGAPPCIIAWWSATLPLHNAHHSPAHTPSPLEPSCVDRPRQTSSSPPR